MERVYSGERGSNGCVVKVDGRLLQPRLDLHTYTFQGFDWGGDGAGETQLAMAILADYYGRWGLEHCALSLAEDFRDLVVCWLAYASWSLAEQEVAAAVREILRERGARAGSAPVGVLM
ncbi:MAG: DUF6166 domain-containing protein [Bacillota bacterium]